MPDDFATVKTMDHQKTPGPPAPKLAFSIDETAAALGISRSYVKRLIGSKRLDARKLGQRVLIPASSVYRLLEEMAVVG